jgi:hypothetical protein
MVNCRWTMSKIKFGEWMWRFLAVVMVFSVGWTAWIIYQLNPPSLIKNAAFEAAAKAKSKARAVPAEKQVSQGVIAASSAAEAVSKAAAASAPAEAPKQPLINPEKLKFSETIALPALPAKK